MMIRNIGKIYILYWYFILLSIGSRVLVFHGSGGITNTHVSQIKETILHLKDSLFGSNIDNKVNSKVLSNVNVQDLEKNQENPNREIDEKIILSIFTKSTEKKELIENLINSLNLDVNTKYLLLNHIRVALENFKEKEHHLKDENFNIQKKKIIEEQLYSFLYKILKQQTNFIFDKYENISINNGKIFYQTNKSKQQIELKSDNHITKMEIKLLEYLHKNKEKLEKLTKIHKEEDLNKNNESDINTNDTVSDFDAIQEGNVSSFDEEFCAPVVNKKTSLDTVFFYITSYIHSQKTSSKKNEYYSAIKEIFGDFFKESSESVLKNLIIFTFIDMVKNNGMKKLNRINKTLVNVNDIDLEIDLNNKKKKLTQLINDEKILEENKTNNIIQENLKKENLINEEVKYHKEIIEKKEEEKKKSGSSTLLFVPVILIFISLIISIFTKNLSNKKTEKSVNINHDIIDKNTLKEAYIG